MKEGIIYGNFWYPVDYIYPLYITFFIRYIKTAVVYVCLDNKLRISCRCDDECG